MKLFLILILFVSCTNLRKKVQFPGFTKVSSLDSSDSQSEHYQNGQHHIFYSLAMEDLDQSEANRLFQNRINYLKSLYQNDKDPYFGKTSRTDECLKGVDLEKQSVTAGSSQSLTFYLPSSDNFVLGQCNPKLESYEAQISFVYCKNNKKFYELKYYKPKDAQMLLVNRPEEICEN